MKKTKALETKPKGKHGGKRFSTKPRCGRKTRGFIKKNGEILPPDKHPCRKFAGQDTDHPGVGPCKRHGGSPAIKHGLYSKYMPKQFLDDYLEHSAEAPKAMDDHISVIDGFILPAAIQQGLNTPKAGMAHPLELPMQAIDIRSKILKRRSDMEDRGKIKMTEAELGKFILQVVAIVSKYVTADIARKIAEEFGVRAMQARIVNG